MNSEFENTINKVNRLKEVEAITLYGSYARGDYDEGSDMDLLILFRNKENLDAAKEKILKIRSNSKLLIQLTMFTLDEFFTGCNPVFVRSILKEGKTIYQRTPNEIKARIEEFTAKYPELFQAVSK